MRKSVHRMLGSDGIRRNNTPNGRVSNKCRTGSSTRTTPRPELERTIVDAGWEVALLQGMDYAGESLASGRFEVGEVAKNNGLYHAAEDCYSLALFARKPAKR